MIERVDTCVLCKAKNPNLPLLKDYYLGHTAHLSCIQQKSCVYCGQSSLCIKCEYKDCTRSFHQHCLKRYFPNTLAENAYLCDLHTRKKGKKKENLRLWLTRQISHKTANFAEVLKKIRESENKTNLSGLGSVFWYVIGTQYFSNFIHISKPEFEVSYTVEYDEKWDFGVSEYSEKLIDEYQRVQKSNHDIINSVKIRNNIETVKNYKEEEMILSELQNLSFKENFEEYLKYLENQPSEDLTETFSIKEKQKKGVKTVQKFEDDVICSICGDGDYEDDNLIVICSKCDIGVHMRCYGISVVPEGDWYCHACLLTKNPKERNSLRCALCPIKAGCVKPTIHQTTGKVRFPNYPENKNELVWCHVFCAIQLNCDVFQNQENSTYINLKNIDCKRFLLKCQVCKTKNGACLQCQHGRCQVAFHPECGRSYFTNKRNKFGTDKVSIYCSMHKPLKLRRIIENKERKTIEDIVKFCKIFEKYEKKAKNPGFSCKRKSLALRPFSCKEKDRFIKIIEKNIEMLSKNKEFYWTICLNKDSDNKISVNKPKNYNILDPQTVYLNKIAIPSRKFTECYKYYVSNIYNLLKQELDLMEMNLFPYVPKEKFVENPQLFRKAKGIPKKTQKSIQKKENKKLKLESLDEIPDDVVSTELYCICRKPFIEQSFIKPWESETDFLIRQKESQMIQCQNCEEWFHYKCIGLNFDFPASENFDCENCKKT